MRVVFVTVGDTGRLTGGYLYNRRLQDGLRERGLEMEQAVASGASPQEQAEAAPGFGETFDPAPYDVVVVDALSRVVCAPHLDRWRLLRPVVVLVHELPGDADPATSDRERAFEGPLLSSDRVVTVSEHGRRLLLERGVPATSLKAVPPGFDHLDEPEHRGAKIVGGPSRVLCVAQWIPRKGILDLVRAWKSANHPVGAVLDLVGETDADRDYAERIEAAVGDDHTVRVRGPVDDAALAALYASADLFALPSRYEGYGIVFAEALSRGLPILACRVGPVPDLVRDAALLVPPADEAALRTALEKLISNPRQREKMSAAAVRRAADLPRWSDTVEEFLGVLREAVEERRR